MSSRRKPVNATAFLLIVMKFFIGVSLSCHPAEYRIGSECCPKCLPGSRVKTHCNEYRSTSCLPCVDGTYTDKSNGLDRCTPCTNCHSSSGLRVNRPCTVTSDTVCEPMKGFYCTNFEGYSCEKAQRHSSCKPGQYISQNGTASTDTECSDCSSGTFSNGTFHSCQPHTRCQTLNLQLITAGTAEADAQCGEHSDHAGAAVGGAVAGLTLIIAGVSGFLYFKKKRKKRRRRRSKDGEIPTFSLNGRQDSELLKGNRVKGKTWLLTCCLQWTEIKHLDHHLSALTLKPAVLLLTHSWSCDYTDRLTELKAGSGNQPEDGLMGYLLNMIFKYH